MVTQQAQTTQKFSVVNKGDYIHLTTWGQLDSADLDAPANAAIAAAQTTGVDKLLDDIRQVETVSVSLPIQAQSVKILWKLRHFRKVAVIFRDREIGWLFFSMLHELHLNSTFKGFDNEAEAIAWLKGS